MRYLRFHASREIIEHPAILVDALCSDGIFVRLDEATGRATGQLDEMDVFVQFHSKRFCSNVTIRIQLSQSSVASTRFAKLGAELKEFASEANKDETKLKAILHGLREEHELMSQACDRISTTLAKIGMTVVDSPTEDELAFVTTHTWNVCELEKLISTIREQQELVSRSVSAQQFEEAVRHRSERERLLDMLYDFCTKEMTVN